MVLLINAIRYLVSTIIQTLHGLESHSSRSVVRFLAELDVFAAFYNHGVYRKLASDLLGEWLILDMGVR